MSTKPEPKPRGQTVGVTPSELTKLKLLWRDSLADSARDFWRALFISATTQAEIRSQLSAKLKINLTRDNQLTDFRQWLADQDARDSEAAAQLEDERRLNAELGDQYSKDQIRELVLKASYARAKTRGDFKLGLATVKQDVAASRMMLDREQWETEAAEKMLSAALRAKADELNNSNLSNADKIAAMRKAAFSDVDELQRSGTIKLPE